MKIGDIVKISSEEILLSSSIIENKGLLISKFKGTIYFGVLITVIYKGTIHNKVDLTDEEMVLLKE